MFLKSDMPWKRRGTRYSFGENIVIQVCFAISHDVCDNANRPFSYSEKESQSNDTLLHFVEFSNVHNSDGSSNATQSNLVNKNV